MISKLTQSWQAGEPLPGSKLVLDSWGVLEWLQGNEPALSRLRLLFSRFEGAPALLMSRMNLGEVMDSTHRILGYERFSEFENNLLALPVRFISVDDRLIAEAFAIKMRFAISCADCFCAAVAIREAAPVLTGDPDFLELQDAGLLRVEWIGR